MNLIALLIGLAIERLASQLFHWRRMRWMERLIDLGFRQALRLAKWPALIPVLLIVLLISLPVFLVIFLLGDALYGFPYLFLAIAVLFFSFGPKDIGEDVDDYCEALESGNEQRIRECARALIESEVPDDPATRVAKTESAVFVQANNRLYAIVFWFVALGLYGPLGAWIYRITDLVRRRAVFQAVRDEGGEADLDRIRDAAVMLHGWLAWIPARLTALGYAIAGHFDAALAAWRRVPDAEPSTTWEASQQLLARVGSGALALQPVDDENTDARAVRGAKAARQLVFRLLIIWAVVIAAMTLYGWSV